MRDVPQSKEIQQTLFDYLTTRERFEEMYAIGKELLEQNAKNPIAIQATISALMELERSEEAIKLLDARIAEDGQNSDLYIIRSNVYLQLDQLDKGIADATKVVELKPDGVEGYFTRARAYLQRVQTDKLGADADELSKARRDIETALDIRRTRPREFVCEP